MPCELWGADARGAALLRFVEAGVSRLGSTAGPAGCQWSTTMRVVSGPQTFA